MIRPPTPPPGADKIEHIVLLMMENRSFDHYLGALTLPPEGRLDVNGLPTPLPTVPDQGGAPVSAWNMDGMYAGYGDPPHGWNDQHTSWNNGANDGFVRTFASQFPGGTGLTAPNIPMGYYTRASLPVLYALTDNFTVCDNWFCSLLSSTWPNRKYFHSGQRDADDDTQTLPPLPGFLTTPLYNLLEDTQNPSTGNNYTWKCYFSDLPFLAFWYKFAAFHAIHSFATVDAFVQDCQEDRLPTVSVIDPPFSLADDHPAHDVRLGQKFIGLIVDALTHSESWRNTALVLLYDENGAFYDHVPPPGAFPNPPMGAPTPAGYDAVDRPFGFRVPAVVISPYPRANGACHTVFEHTSILKSIQTRWGVPFGTGGDFGTRWESATDIWNDCFNFNRPPLPMGTYTQPAADLAAGLDPPFKGLNWTSGVNDLLGRPLGGVEAFLERIFVLPGLKALDRRAQLFDTLSAMEKSVVNLKRLLP